MATSGSKSVSVTSYDTLKFSWNLDGQSTSNNTSTVSWKMELISTSSGRISSTASKAWSVTVNGTKYSGTNTVGIAASSTKTLASGTTTIKHNTDGTKTFSYSFSQGFGITFSGSSIGIKSGSGSGTLTTIARAATLTSSPNFTDEENPVIKYSNSAGNSVTTLQACIADTTGNTIYVPYRDISKTGTSYIFNLTDAERTTLRNACKNAKSMSVKFYIKTVLSGTTYYSKSFDKTLTITNAAPTVTATAKDAGTVTTPITGDSSKMVKGYNYISVSMTATGLKGATIKSYKITNGSKAINAASGSFTNATDGSFVFTATDSRGYTTSKTINLSVINYVPLTCNVKGSMTVDGIATATISGKYFNGSIGATANTLTVSYRYKESGGTYSSWTAATATKSGNTYTADFTISGLDYRKKYVIQAKAVDKLLSIESNQPTLNSLPVFDWGENDFNFNVPVTITSGGNTYNLLGLVKAMSTNYTLTTTHSAGTNWTVSSSGAVLIGNNLRLNFTANRSSAIVGNIDNEEVLTLSIKHDGKIASTYNMGFSSAGTGAVCSFVTDATNDGTTLTVKVNIAATATSTTAVGAYFTMPCRLNLNAY